MDALLLPRVAQFIDRNMVTVPFPGKQSLVTEAVSALQSFLEQPMSHHQQKILADASTYELGYLRRDDDEHKSLFQFAPSLLTVARESGIDALVTLCEAPALLFDRCEQLMLSFVQVLDRVMPGYGFHLLASQPSSRQMNMLRIVRYDKAGAGAMIGKWHSDISFLTLHVADSRPALRLGTADWLYEGSPEDALVFPGDKMPRVCRRFRPVRHAVIEQAYSKYALQKERWSVVFFFHINLELLPWR